MLLLLSIGNAVVCCCYGCLLVLRVAGVCAAVLVLLLSVDRWG